MKRTPRGKAEPTVTITREELERWDGLLARAQHEAIHAAPRALPRLGDGQVAAIQCFDTLRTVRESIARATPEGGAS